jgi:hypothetical protein
MQVFDQEIAAARAIAEQGGDLMRRVRIGLAALRHRPGPAAALARMLEMPDFVDVCVCVSVFLAHSRASAAASWRALLGT